MAAIGRYRNNPSIMGNERQESDALPTPPDHMPDIPSPKQQDADQQGAWSADPRNQPNPLRGMDDLPQPDTSLSYPKRYDMERQKWKTYQSGNINGRTDEATAPAPVDADTLMAQWTKADEEKRRAYEQSQRKHDALANIFRGYEAFFNSDVVRHGGIASPSSAATFDKAKQDRFDRYKRDREALKDAYTRRLTKLRQDQSDAIDMMKLKRDIDRNEATSTNNANRLNETIRHNTALEDLNERKRQDTAANNQARNDLSQDRLGETQRHNKTTESISAARLVETQRMNDSKLDSTGSSYNTRTKVYAAGGRSYNMPKSMTEGRFKDMQSRIMGALGIKEAEPVLDERGNPAIDYRTMQPATRKRTASEIAREIDQKWNAQADAIVRQYGGVEHKPDSNRARGKSTNGRPSPTGKPDSNRIQGKSTNAGRPSPTK